MRIVMYISLVIFLGLAVYDIVAAKNEGDSLCKSAFFLVAAFFNQLANAFFIYVGYRVYSSVKQYN